MKALVWANFRDTKSELNFREHCSFLGIYDIPSDLEGTFICMDSIGTIQTYARPVGQKFTVIMEVEGKPGFTIEKVFYGISKEEGIQ